MVTTENIQVGKFYQKDLTEETYVITQIEGQTVVFNPVVNDLTVPDTEMNTSIKNFSSKMTMLEK